MKAPLKELVKIPKADRIPYFDKPPALGGQLRYLTPDEFKQKFGCEYSESLFGLQHLLPTPPQEELDEFYGVDRQVFFDPHVLKNEIKKLYESGNAQLAIGFINESVGHGVFALDDIPKGTPVCIYSGELCTTLAPNLDDSYLQTIVPKLYVSAKDVRGMSGFMQHLPTDCEEHKKLASEGLDQQFANSINLGLCPREYVDAEKKNADQETRKANPEFNEIVFKNIDDRKNMAMGNFAIVGDVINGVRVHVLVAMRDIKKGESVGCSYGFSYWADRSIVPELFTKSGEVLPHQSYDRKRFARCYVFKELHDIFSFRKNDPFWSCIEKHEYSKAVRTACTNKNHGHAIKLVSALLGYKKELGIDLSEQPGDAKLAAIHHAAKAGNKKLVELLVTNGAEVTLRDSDHKTASDYLAQAESQTLVAAKIQQTKASVKKDTVNKSSLLSGMLKK